MSVAMRGHWGVKLFAAVVGLAYIYGALRTLSFQFSVGFFVAGTFTLCFVVYPARRKTEKSRITVVDIAWILLVWFCSVYFILYFNDMVRRAGRPSDLELAIGVAAIVFSLEVARRALGYVLPVLALLLLAYNYFGSFLPGGFGHPGFSERRIIDASFRDTGIYGLIASTYARYVLLFAVFGAILVRMGIADALLNMGINATKGVRAGPAKAGVAMSAGFGSVAGSGIANIAITAPMMIPLMRKAGMNRDQAGGLETAASIGGQIVPPVMGAGAFLVAAFAGVSYAEIVAVALAPAFLYYMSIFATVHFEAGRDQDPPKRRWSQVRTDVLDVLRGTWSLIPIGLLLLLLVLEFRPFRAAVYSIACAVLIALFRSRSVREAARVAYDGIGNGVLDMAPVAATAGVIGIVLAMVNLPGLPIRFSSFAFGLVGGSLLAAFLMVILVSLVMGMGMTVVAAYVIVAVLAVPLLDELGVPILAAHLVVFWLSLDSSVTPPFALGAFVAAGVSGGDSWKTAWHAFKYAKPLYLVTLMMLYTPLITGDPTDVLRVTLTGSVGMILIGAGVAGNFRRRCPVWLRVILIAAGGVLLTDNPVWQAAGIGIGLVTWLAQRFVDRRDPAGGERTPEPSTSASTNL